ncbi:MAG: hypothetical protein KC464_14560, partial [Myxococcales bacterium]|nr:hypothetical protein [Myxococcales bacterium]
MTATYTLEDWHQLHPWPTRLGDGKRIEFLWRFTSAASPEEVWRVLSDTSRLNRALGGPEMRFEERGGQLFGQARSGGVRHRWRELPWSWVAGEWLECVRVYDRGFPRVMQSVHRIDPGDDGGAVVHVGFAFLPRGVVGAAAIRLGFPSLEKG